MQSVHLRARQRKLWHFHGGVHLPDEKALSNQQPVEPAALPRQLIIPIQQHIGVPAQPCVAVGDRVLKGQVIAQAHGYVSATIHASSSGTVIAIEEHPIPHPSGLSALCIRIDTDGQDTWTALPAPMSDFEQHDRSEIRERIRWAGVVGLGGASFPTSVKLNPGSDNPIKTLVINGAECEPYITCDDLLMRERSTRILDGIRIIRYLLRIETCLIGIEDNKPEAIAAIELAVAEAGLREWIDVVAIPTLYPSGGEKQLIQILTGKEVPSNGIPAHIGILCQNVGSCAAIADAVLDGRPLISRFVTISGRGIAAPRNLDVRIGTPVAELTERCGGTSGDVRALICGGPMMGFAVSSERIPVTKATNCFLALTNEETADPDGAMACIRCGRCADVCPASLLPQQLYWYARAKDMDKVQDYDLFDCIECGCCAHVCPSHIPLVQYYRYAKTESWSREQDRRKADHARERHEARQARIERLERERQAKLRRKKEALNSRTTATGSTGTDDPKKAAIEAARKRAAAKKAAIAEKGIAPKNTANLSPAQQRQVDAADARREAATAKSNEE